MVTTLYFYLLLVPLPSFRTATLDGTHPPPKKVKGNGTPATLTVLPFWGAGLGPSAVLTLERQVEAEWFDYPKGKTGVSLTERFPMPPSSLLGQMVSLVSHQPRTCFYLFY